MSNAILGLIGGLLVACFWENLQHTEQVCPDQSLRIAVVEPLNKFGYNADSVWIRGDKDNVNLLWGSGGSTAGFEGSADGGATFGVTSTVWSSGSSVAREPLSVLSSTTINAVEHSSSSVLNLYASTNSGSTWGSAVDVISELTDTEYLGSHCFALPSGGRTVIISTHVAGSPQRIGFLSIYTDDNGATFSPTTVEDDLSAFTTGISNFYSEAAVDAAGHIHVVVLKSSVTFDSTEYIYYKSTDSGSSYSKVIGGGFSGQYQLRSLYIDGYGEAYTLWYNDSSGEIEVLLPASGLIAPSAIEVADEGWTAAPSTNRYAFFTDPFTQNLAFLSYVTDGASERGVAVGDVVLGGTTTLRHVSMGSTSDVIAALDCYVDSENFLHVAGKDAFLTDISYAKFQLSYS